VELDVFDASVIPPDPFSSPTAIEVKKNELTVVHVYDPMDMFIEDQSAAVLGLSQ
jgi:hypothetical protein